MSKINEGYQEVINDLAERAVLIHEEQPELDDSECVRQGIDDGFLYGEDQAYTVARAITTGFITWGQAVDWQEVYEMLHADVSKDYQDRLESQEDQTEIPAEGAGIFGWGSKAKPNRSQGWSNVAKDILCDIDVFGT